MKVSVIIPTYNRAHLVSEAINSVLNQTYQDFEIIVVDDGSTDETHEKLKPYQDKIKYVYVKNGGTAYARNVGMKMAKGEYITFLDSDDLYYPHKIKIQANFLDKYNDIAMVYTELSAFDSNMLWEEFHLKKYHESAYKNNDVTYEDIFSETISISAAGLNIEKWGNRKIYIGNIFDKYFQNLIVFTNSVMFRRKILETIGMQDEQYWLFEEYDFVLRITKHYRVAFIDVPTYKLRYHSDQISSTKRSDGPQVLINKQRNLLEIAEKHGLYDGDYYTKNKDIVDKKLAGLNRALAISLMATGRNEKLARKHLRKCVLYGKPEYLLWFLTFTPHFIRRISFKVLSMLKVIN